MKLRGTMLIPALAMLAGCQTTAPVSEVDNQAQILAAIPANYRQEVPIYLRGSIDPATLANAEITRPILGAVGSVDGAQVPLVCVRLTGRDASGSLGAVQTIGLVFQDGRIISRVDNNAACSSPVYSSFAELRTQV